MSGPDPRFRAGPVGRAKLSPALMRRHGMPDPRLTKNANLHATNRHTPRGVLPLALDYTAVPTGVEDELVKVVNKLNEVIANLQQRGSMELSP